MPRGQSKRQTEQSRAWKERLRAWKQSRREQNDNAAEAYRNGSYVHWETALLRACNEGRLGGLQCNDISRMSPCHAGKILSAIGNQYTSENDNGPSITNWNLRHMKEYTTRIAERTTHLPGADFYRGIAQRTSSRETSLARLTQLGKLDANTRRSALCELHSSVEDAGALTDRRIVPTLMDNMSKELSKRVNTLIGDSRNDLEAVTEYMNAYPKFDQIKGKYVSAFLTSHTEDSNLELGGEAEKECLEQTTRYKETLNTFGEEANMQMRTRLYAEGRILLHYDSFENLKAYFDHQDFQGGNTASAETDWNMRTSTQIQEGEDDDSGHLIEGMVQKTALDFGSSSTWHWDNDGEDGDEDVSFYGEKAVQAMSDDPRWNRSWWDNPPSATNDRH
ncbi:uncharacterized protein I303_107107 [Kwoniella dejecticola CBS 10117]|uniref:Uncharacterized protein n=1 Tax=Kwoniella dejecticola CBS 10117 TaxID=1296121 RepID=A0A1A5ZYR3_9TREE|nr:uncharacterized protein I303_06509 [Kwoniella dejecticola CBS 10117]OBR82951.1 hypothetical protein I303_06509 [Kwoniella dejecticola CBS 10117]